ESRGLGDVYKRQRLHLSDITLPMGVKFVPHGDDTNPLLAQANPAKGAASEDAADAPAAE
ncbi:MAG: 50S ribosomal protein L25, partial [Castellaniella sp.]